MLSLFDPFPSEQDIGARRSLAHHPLVKHCLGVPLHYLVGQRGQRTDSKNIKRHLWSADYPQRDIWTLENFGALTSPEMTLLLMARACSPVRLALAMYELCGSFSVFTPPPELEGLLQGPAIERINAATGWSRVRDAKGNPTSLWNRPSLLSLERLRAFAGEHRSARGGRAFAQAVSLVAGVTRSPFEAQAALLLSAPRRLGGYGFALETNRIIRLSSAARKLYHHDYCEADLCLKSPDGSRIVDVECQGAVVHSGLSARMADANRTTALESMGISVVQITYADISRSDRTEVIVDHLASKLGIELKPRTQPMYAAERKLRAEIPSDWGELG